MIKIENLIDICSQAGKKILEIYQKSDKKYMEIEYKSDNSPLTLADRESHEIICSSLSNLVEGLIDKDIQLVKIPYENSEKLFKKYPSFYSSKITRYKYYW